MCSKIFFLVLLGASLTLAVDIEREYIEVSKQRDLEAIQNYFKTTDPLSLRLQWDMFLGRALYILEVGKEKAIEQADISQVEQVKKEWAEVQEQGTAGQYEVRQIIDSLRARALVKAPREWAQVAQMSANLFEAFKKASAEGSANNMKKALTLCRQSFRKVNTSLSAYLDASLKSHIA